MQKRNELKKLAGLFELSDKYGELQKALTHKSFYSQKHEHKSNSRYVFSGMYVFKGNTAAILHKYIIATGTQLQHFLGNLFKNKYLEEIFDKYCLNKIIRCGETFDYTSYKHIFVYGFLGFIAEYSNNEVLNNFILSNFLIGKEHLILNNPKAGSITVQCNYFSQILYSTNIVVESVPTTDTMNKFIVKTGSNIIAQAESKSFRYARKKALKMALNFMSEIVSKKYTQTEEYKIKKNKKNLLKLAEETRNKNIKEQKHREKVEKKKAENIIKRESQKKEAQLKDIKRREANKKAKIRKQEIKEFEEKRKRKIENMSVAKKRHLQDKQK